MAALNVHITYKTYTTRQYPVHTDRKIWEVCSLHVKVVRLSDSSTGRLYSHGKYTHFRPQCHSAAGRIMPMKKKNPMTTMGIEPETFRLVEPPRNPGTRHRILESIILCNKSRKVKQSRYRPWSGPEGSRKLRFPD